MATSASDDIAAALREEILRGDLPAELPLRQDALARRFGVSHIPVREALRHLAAEGLVVIRRHQGARVSAISAADAQELLEIRCLLETQAVRWALPRASEATLAVAEKALGRAEKVKGLDDWMHLNWQFHSSLYAAADRPRLVAMIDALDAQIDRFIRVLMTARPNYRKQAEREHRAILAAYGVGNADAVCSLLNQHMAETAQLLGAALTERRQAQRND